MKSSLLVRTGPCEPGPQRSSQCGKAPPFSISLSSRCRLTESSGSIPHKRVESCARCRAKAWGLSFVCLGTGLTVGLGNAPGVGPANDTVSALVPKRKSWYSKSCASRAVGLLSLHYFVRPSLREWALALDHAGDHTRVNSISPGSIRTPTLAGSAPHFIRDKATETVFERFGAHHPLGRIAPPEEVGELAAFLASDQAGFCAGGDYLVDGGLLAGIGV